MMMMVVMIRGRQTQRGKWRRRARILVKMLETADGCRQWIHSHRWMMRDLEFIFHAITTSTAGHFIISCSSTSTTHSDGDVRLMWRHNRFHDRWRGFHDWTLLLLLLDWTGAVAAAQAAPFTVIGAERRIHIGRHDGRSNSRRWSWWCWRLLVLMGVVQFARVFLEIEIAAKSFTTNAARKLLQGDKRENNILLFSQFE